VTKQPKRHAYLVSVAHEIETVRVYATLAVTPDEALETVALMIAPDAELAIVGGLSPEMAKRMRLKVGEPQLV
jgi:hypothetical protein